MSRSRLTSNWGWGASQEHSLHHLKKMLRAKHPNADAVIQEIERRYGGVDGKPDPNQSRSNVGAKLRHVYRIFDPGRGTLYVGLSLNVRQRICMHRRQGTEAVRALLAGAHQVEVLTAEKVPESDAQRLEAMFIRKYLSEGWRVLNVARAGGLGSDIRYCRGDILAAAAVCRDRAQFKSFYPRLFESAYNAGFLDTAFALHPLNGWLNQPRRYWTMDRIRATARGCADFFDFVDRFPDAHEYVKLGKIRQLRQEIWPNDPIESEDGARVAAIRQAKGLPAKKK